MRRAPADTLTPEWFPGQYHDPATLSLPMWRRWPDPQPVWITKHP